MPIQFSSPLSSVTANNTFLDKTVDDAKKGVLSLYKVSIGESDAIDDVQVDINGLKSRLDFANNAVYFGDPATNGSWRIFLDGTDLKIQIRVASVWQTRDTFQP